MLMSVNKMEMFFVTEISRKLEESRFKFNFLLFLFFKNICIESSKFSLKLDRILKKVFYTLIACLLNF